MSVNTTQIKEKIIEFIRQRGPSLPVYISKAIDNSILFTSAFLSELVSEKKIKISHMRVGSSPIYFLQGQEPQLEKFSDYLKSKEKDAFFLLKEKKFLQDSSQEPAIRVALRDIKDFALPFKKDNEIYWRYFTASESEMFLPAKKVQEKKPEPKKNLNIFDKPQKSKEQEKKLIKKKFRKPIKTKSRIVLKYHWIILKLYYHGSNNNTGKLSYHGTDPSARLFHHVYAYTA